MTEPPRCPPRLTDEDVLRLWRARDVHEGRQNLIGCLTTVALLEVCLFSLAGGWSIALLIVGLQAMLIVTPRAVLMWVGHWRQRRSNPPTKGPYAHDR